VHYEKLQARGESSSRAERVEFKTNARNVIFPAGAEVRVKRNPGIESTVAAAFHAFRFSVIFRSLEF
jgi:hypothetical protein